MYNIEGVHLGGGPFCCFHPAVRRAGNTQGVLDGVLLVYRDGCDCYVLVTWRPPGLPCAVSRVIASEPIDESCNLASSSSDGQREEGPREARVPFGCIFDILDVLLVYGWETVSLVVCMPRWRCSRVS